jgi:hypothetical protein
MERLTTEQVNRIFKYAEILGREGDAVLKMSIIPSVIWTSKNFTDYTIQNLQDVRDILGVRGYNFVIRGDR